MLVYEVLVSNPKADRFRKLTWAICDCSIERGSDNSNIEELSGCSQALDVFKVGKRRDAAERPLDGDEQSAWKTQYSRTPYRSCHS
jgi:hypothetical protein